MLVIPVSIGLLGLVLVVLMIRFWLRARGLANWPSVQGRILTSGATTPADSASPAPGGRRSRGPRYAISYEYTVNERRYTANNVTLTSPLQGRVNLRHGVTQRYPPGARVPVYYDPADP